MPGNVRHLFHAAARKLSEVDDTIAQHLLCECSKLLQVILFGRGKGKVFWRRGLAWYRYVSSAPTCRNAAADFGELEDEGDLPASSSDDSSDDSDDSC